MNTFTTVLGALVISGVGLLIAVYCHGRKGQHKEVEIDHAEDQLHELVKESQSTLLERELANQLDEFRYPDYTFLLMATLIHNLSIKSGDWSQIKLRLFRLINPNSNGIAEAESLRSKNRLFLKTEYVLAAILKEVVGEDIRRLPSPLSVRDVISVQKHYEQDDPALDFMSADLKGLISISIGFYEQDLSHRETPAFTRICETVATLTYYKTMDNEKEASVQLREFLFSRCFNRSVLVKGALGAGLLSVLPICPGEERTAMLSQLFNIATSYGGTTFCNLVVIGYAKEFGPVALHQDLFNFAMTRITSENGPQYEVVSIIMDFFEKSLPIFQRLEADGIEPANAAGFDNCLLEIYQGVVTCDWRMLEAAAKYTFEGLLNKLYALFPKYRPDIIKTFISSLPTRQYWMLVTDDATTYYEIFAIIERARSILDQTQDPEILVIAKTMFAECPSIHSPAQGHSLRNRLKHGLASIEHHISFKEKTNAAKITESI